MISTVQNQSQQTIRSSPIAQRPIDLTTHERVLDHVMPSERQKMQSGQRLSTDGKTKSEHSTGPRSPYIKHEVPMHSPILRTQSQGLASSTSGGSSKANVHDVPVARRGEMEGRRQNQYGMVDIATSSSVPRSQCWPPFAGIYGPNKLGRTNAEMSQYKRHIEPVGGVGSLVQSNGKHLPPRFSDYAIPNRADHASDTNQLLSIVRTRAVRTTQDELENLRVLCQKLEHQLQQQLTQISSLEKVEKKTAELGAQWNFFHHAQMQKQAIMYREHYEKREAELKAHQADLQNRLTLVSRENALLKGKVGLCGNVTQVSSTVKQSITSSHPVHSPRAMHGHTAAPSKLKRKSMSLTSVEPLKLECLDDRDASHTTRIQPVNVTSDVAGEKMDESRRAVQTSSRIPTRTSSAPELLESSDESRESPCKKPRLSSLPNSSTMNVPVPLAAPLQLVDGILPPPVKIVLDNQERYIDPKIAEIKQDLATGTAEQKTMIPPIVTGS